MFTFACIIVGYFLVGLIAALIAIAAAYYRGGTGVGMVWFIAPFLIPFWGPLAIAALVRWKLLVDDRRAKEAE